MRIRRASLTVAHAISIWLSSNPLRVLDTRNMRKIGAKLRAPFHAGGSSISLSATSTYGQDSPGDVR
jgi:hypothetical protein